MNYLSISPFVPSGSDFIQAQSLFSDLGFTRTWGNDSMAAYEQGPCHFILQNYDEKGFAENFMLSVRVPDIDAFHAFVTEKEIAKRYNIKITPVTNQPWAREVVIVDMAGVCWHFVQA
jgi:hypothetical protein